MNKVFNSCKLIITPNSVKKKLINNSELKNVKYMCKEDINKKFYYDYDYNAIKYVMKKYDIKFDNAKIFIDNTYYVDNILIKNNIINKIKELKKELIDNNLLIFDSNFKYYLKNVNVEIFGYDFLDKYYYNLFSEIGKITDVKYNLTENIDKNKTLTVYGFNTTEEECVFVCEKIIDLISSGVDINKIFITNYSDEYESVINKIFKMHNIPINLNCKNSIINTNVGNVFANLIKDNENCEYIISSVEKYFNDNNIDIESYNAIINICNKYLLNNNIDFYDKECILNELKNTNINKFNLNNAVNIVPYSNNTFNDDEYIFFIGFNQENVPKIYKNEDFLSDKIKLDNNLSTSIDMNIKTKESLINKLYSMNNLIISYKLSDEFSNFYKSNLINELKMNEILDYKFKYIYSNNYNKFKLCKELDNLIKYGIHSNILDKLYNSYNSINYFKYDNKFSEINKNNFIKYLNNKLLLSYTHLDNYNRCGFRYYLNNILKLDNYEETISIKIGNLYHYILSKAFNDNFDFNNEFNEYLKTMNLNSKELFFINNLKKELLDTIDIIKYQNSLSSLNNELYEEKIYINDTFENISVTFMGVIDKVKYKMEGNNYYIAIIDYKTGIPKINLDYTKYGINMQLPIYLYLAKHLKKFDNGIINFIGFYLQKICSKTLDSSKDEKIQKLDSLKLQGFTTDDINLIQMFDSSYNNSQIIKSMKVTNNGFYKYSKVLSEKKINNLIKMIDNIIKNNIKDIINAKFDINPKKIDNENVGCEFCNYKDICFKKENDIVNLNNVDYNEFLGD